eukprot:COSAG03_NODE_5361_length_1268_cov_0.872541_2_plen_260_part_00
MYCTGTAELRKDPGLASWVHESTSPYKTTRTCVTPAAAARRRGVIDEGARGGAISTQRNSQHRARDCSAKVVARTVTAMQAAATQTVAQLGWSRVFSKFDFNDDGSLSKGEFTRAVRAECQLSAQELADAELWLVFDMIDVDHSGTIDAAEFVLALSDDTGKEDLVLSVTGFRMCLLELADTWAMERTPEQYVQFLKTLFGHVTEGTAGKGPGGLVLGSAAGMNYALRDISTIPVGAMWQHVATDDRQPGQSAQNPHRE